MQLQTKQQIESIYFLRLFAMLMVVLVHVTAPYIGILPFDSGAYQKYFYLNRIIRIEAGVFIALAGIVFFYNYMKKTITPTVLKDYYKKRVVYIVVPYLVWALIYEGYSYYIGIRDVSEYGLGDLLNRLFTGQSYYQLHFIFIIVQLYIVLPLFIFMAQKIEFFRKYMWLFGIIIELGYYMLNRQFGIISFPFFMNSLGTFLLGGWIGSYYLEQRKKASKMTTNSFLFVFMLALGFTAVYFYYHIFALRDPIVPYQVYRVFWLAYLMVGTYFLFRVAEVLATKVPRNFMSRVRHVAMYSFGYYLLHPIVLSEVRKLIPLVNSYVFNVQILVQFLLTVLICYIIIALTHRYVPFANIIFGKLPAIKKQKREKTL